MVKRLVSNIAKKIVNITENITNYFRDYIIEIDKDTNLPVYVSLNKTALRLLNGKYVRDSGLWRTDFVERDGCLYSHIPDKSYIHNVKLTPISKRQWEEDNGHRHFGDLYWS